jgi:hypothetical protein
LYIYIRALTQEAKYIQCWPNTTSAWAGWRNLIFQWIVMVEYISFYSAPAVHFGLLLAIRSASRKTLIEQNIKIRTGPAL